jgi:hypothetical protein
MKTFIEQKEECRRAISELEQENMRLERQIDANEDKITFNSIRITELEFTLTQIGQPSESK